ncbi:MAG: hypothetical protein QG589_503 [Patescibacteria group bacterium]|nr:hypothetical protein [Patescibacteria group bacterium]
MAGECLMIEKIISVWSDVSGQDLIEYALMCGFVATAALAIVPGVAPALLAGTGFPVGYQTEKLARITGIFLAVVFLGIIILRRKGEQE